MREYHNNEHVVYGNTGVCLIENTKRMAFPGQSEEKNYYILKPIGSNASTIFVPCDNEALNSKMRYVLSKEEIDELLCSIKDDKIEWIENKNEREDYFHRIVTSGNQQKLLLMVNCLYNKKLERLAEGKKLTVSDENTLKSAERMINEEFSFSLHLIGEQVGEYIKEKMGA